MSIYVCDSFICNLMNEVCSLDKHQLVFNLVKQKCGKYETFLCHRVSELYIISAKKTPDPSKNTK